MDGPFWVDLRAPHMDADVGQITLTGANKFIVPVANLPALGSNYFSYRGKAVRITMFGRITTAATPGNGTFSLLWGTGADANGTAVATSPAFTLLANQANMSWRLELTVRCRALGATGALIAMGQMNFNTSVVAAGFGLIPATAPAQVSVDLTQNFVLSPQFLRTGSTVETITVHEFMQEALN